VQLGLQGLAATNEAGLVTFGATQAPASFAFANAPLQTVNTPVDLSSVVSGLSPMVSMINQQVLDGASAVFGTQTTGGQGVLAVWLDPVDFVLTDAQGNQVGTVDGQNINTIPNAFLSTSSSVDLLLVPAASASQYNLSLLGNGSDFRGALNLISSDGTSTVPVEGNLASGQNLVAVLDFRQSAETSVGGLTSTTPTSPSTPAPTSLASLASTAFVGLDRLLSVSALAPLGLARTAMLAIGSGPIETLLIGIGGVSQAGANVPSARVEIGAVTARLAADGSLSADFVLPPGEAAWSTRVEQAATDAAANLELVGIRIDRQKDAATVTLEYVLTRPNASRPLMATLIWAGPNHKFGDADDRRIELVRPEVQAADKRLELRFEAPPLTPGEYRLMVPAPLAPAAPAPPLRTSFVLPLVDPTDGSRAAVEHQPADEIADVDRFWETWLPARSKRDAVVIRSDERLAVSGADRG
jgi:hypothetical protein